MYFVFNDNFLICIFENVKKFFILYILPLNVLQSQNNLWISCFTDYLSIICENKTGFATWLIVIIFNKSQDCLIFLKKWDSKLKSKVKIWQGINIINYLTMPAYYSKFSHVFPRLSSQQYLSMLFHVKSLHVKIYDYFLI